MTQTFDLEEYRNSDVISSIQRNLDSREEIFSVHSDLRKQIRGFASISDIMPKFIDGRDLEAVREAQTVLHTLQSRMDFVGDVQEGCNVRIRSLVSLEKEAQRYLLASGFLKFNETGINTAKKLDVLLPDVFNYLRAWNGLRDYCVTVRSSLRDAMFLIKDQIKLESGYHAAAPRV